MSLVAYDASDESESEELTEKSPLTTDQKQVIESHYVEAKEVSYKIDSIPTSPPISDSDSDFEESKESGDVSTKPTSSLLLGLPEPKRLEQNEKLAVEEDELEDEVKPKASQMTDVPKPPAKKLHQPVKIVIPALPTGDSDEDTDEPVKKKLKPSNTNYGLVDLLPTPVHAAKKEANRVLLPYSLTKKQQPQKENTPKMTSLSDLKTSSSLSAAGANLVMSASMKALITATYDSDSDEEDDKNAGSPNFFSLHSDQQNLSAVAHVTSSLSSDSAHKWIDSSDVPTAPLPSSSFTRTPIHLPAPKMNTSSSAMDDSDIPTLLSAVKQPDADAPLKFNASFPQRSGHISTTYGPALNYADSGVSGQDETEVYNSCTNDQYEPMMATETLDPVQLMQDEEFLKLQGKKARGKEEINIVDVNADDFVASTEELTKNLTEEKEHKSQKSKDLPSSQQRRKHQITYLAFQAKERELELKNQWATNRQTKRQTQAKYGF